jgi:hypothetical protein
MKAGERIVRGPHPTVNRSIAAALCIAAENVAKLFWREIVGGLGIITRARGFLRGFFATATTGFGRCERGILRFAFWLCLLESKVGPP